MNSSDIPGLTPAQARDLRAQVATASAKAEERASEIEAGWEVLDLADERASEIEAAQGGLDLADEHEAEMKAASGVVRRFTVSRGSYVSSAAMDAANERITQAAARAADAFRSPALDAVTADIAETIAPAFDGIRESMLQSVRPALDSLVQPHVFGAFKPDLLGPVKPKLFEMPDLVGPLKLDLFGSQGLVAPVIRTPEVFRFGPEIVGHRFEGLNLGLTDQLLPNLASLGWNPSDLALRSPLFDTASMVGSWGTVLPQIDLGAFNQVNQAASMLTGMWPLIGKDALSGFLPDMPTLNVFGDLQENIFGDLQESIRSLLGNWGTLADFGHGLAEAGLFAARVARQAVLNGDDETVAAFARHWLGIKRLTEAAIEAVKSALLDDRWLGKAAGSVAKFIRRLYKEEYHPAHRPEWERRLGRQKVGSLNWPVVQPSGGTVERGELLLAPEPGANDWQVSDPHALMVMNRFSAEEQQILQAMFSTSEPGMTWAMAAEDCGKPAAKGEAVRRKLKRESARVVAAVSR